MLDRPAAWIKESKSLLQRQKEPSGSPGGNGSDELANIPGVVGARLRIVSVERLAKDVDPIQDFFLSVPTWPFAKDCVVG